jgi:hypothetical protein
MLTKFLAAPAVLAAASLTATPAAAAELPTIRHAPIEATSHYGPYVSGGWGWGGGYRGRHRRGSDAGDILAGVLILGTIAAVASAASKAQQQRRSYPYPQRYPYPDSHPQPERRYDTRPTGPQGLEGAADLCLREVERNSRAREVTRVERSASGWLVTGAMADGSNFSCSIGADGRIESVNVGDRMQRYREIDERYEQDRYRSSGADSDAGTQPAYPGGPVDGDDGEADAPES